MAPIAKHFCGIPHTHPLRGPLLDEKQWQDTRQRHSCQLHQGIPSQLDLGAGRRVIQWKFSAHHVLFMMPWHGRFHAYEHSACCPIVGPFQAQSPIWPAWSNCPKSGPVLEQLCTPHESICIYCRGGRGQNYTVYT